MERQMEVATKFKSREQALEAALRELLKSPNSQDAKIAARVALASTPSQFEGSR
jgi:spore germination protein GerM